MKPIKLSAKKTATLKARIAKGNIDLNKVVFRTSAGVEYTPEYEGSVVHLKVSSGLNKDGQDLYALYKVSDTSYKSMGKITLLTYELKTLDMVIVPLEGVSYNFGDIQTELNNIYGPLGIEWRVKTDSVFRNKQFGLIMNDILDAEESQSFSMYSPEMRALNRLYKEQRGVDSKTMYMFVVKEINGKRGGLLGDMPLSSQFGYLAASNDVKLAAKTIAHELGHGMFYLRHTFSQYNFVEGSTDNLMDYKPEGTQLFKKQWDEIFDPRRPWFAWRQDEEEGAAKVRYQLNFIINEKTYKSGETFVILYTNRELEIKIECSDTTFRFDKIKWQLEGKDIPGKTEHPEKLSIKISPTVLQKEKNKLVILDSLNKKLIDLEIRVYHPPHIIFDRNRNYNGEFLFDKGFEFASLEKPEYYDTIHVGSINKVYYAPVLGLNLNQTADINISKKDFPSFAKDDGNFKVVIKASQDGYVKINGMDSLVLDANAFTSLNNITIKSERFLGANSLNIYAYIPIINKKIGLLEYYCRFKEPKTVHLIYVKFKDETRYPRLDYSKLKAYLNTNSMNQLFLDMLVDTVHLNSSHRTTDFAGRNSAYILQLLITEMYGYQGFPSDAGLNVDYYFITNLDRGNVGGFHITGDAGGVQTLWKGSASGETQEEVTAHELGHWQGLPHTFKTLKSTNTAQQINAPFFPITEFDGGTRDNFMDYGIRRKTWFKFQFLNLKK